MQTGIPAKDNNMTDNAQARAARLIHLRRSGYSLGDPVPLPLTMAATYHSPGDATGYNQYGRFSNPTWDAVEKVLGHLEDAPCVAFPSGMAAIASIFFGLLTAGDRVLLPSDGYHTTRGLAERFLGKLGIGVDVRPTASFLDGGFAGYRLVFVESPSNPVLDICDIAAVAKAVHAAGGILAVDNTTMTPYGQRPLDLGADIVVAADTGPEVIAGSTRLKAGAAQKLVLNTISTVVMVRLGRTFGNLMVDVRAGSEKLVDRARRIVVTAAGVTPAEAAAALEAANGEVKTAIVCLLAGVDAATARRRLDQSGGVVRRALSAP